MRRAATAAVLGLALVGFAGPATAADIDVAPPAEAHPYYQVDQVVLTDGAVYIATGYYNPLWSARETQIWRRNIYTGPGGTTLGNAQFVGSSVPLWWGYVMAASDDAMLYVERGSGGLQRHDDAGGSTRVSLIVMGVPASFDGAWYTSWDTLYPVPDPSDTATGGLLLGRSTEPWPWPVAHLSPTGGPPQVGDTAVAWIEGAIETMGGRDGRRVYANALDAAGFVGEPVVLDEDPNGVGLTPVDVQVSDDVVAWLSVDDASGDGVVRWVPADDLSADPQELALTDPGDQLVLDGTRVAYSLGAGGGAATTVLDLASGTEVATLPGAGTPVDLHGDLLARATYPGDGNKHVVITSISGAAVDLARRFPDVSVDSPFVGHVDRLAIDGITGGYPDGTFRPLEPVTREAMAAFLFRQAGEPAFTPPATSPFTDVTTGHPFYAEIAWLADAGISTGWDNGDGTASVRPGEAVSREAMAAFLYRQAGEPASTPPATSPFTDVTPGHPFYAEIAWLAEAGVSTGWRTAAGAEFRPGAPVERQAMAAFLVRFTDLP